MRQRAFVRGLPAKTSISKGNNDVFERLKVFGNLLAGLAQGNHHEAAHQVQAISLLVERAVCVVEKLDSFPLGIGKQTLEFNDIFVHLADVKRSEIFVIRNVLQFFVYIEITTRFS